MVSLPYNGLRRLLGATMIIAGVLGASACGSPADAAVALPAQVSPAPSPTPAPGASGVDVSRLVITAADIPLPGLTRQSVQAVTQGPLTGATALFGTADGTKQVGETIVVLPDAAAARTAVQGAVSSTQSQRPGSTTSTVPVGDQGVVITGYQQNGTASTLLLFSQGVASVAMDFRSPATDPVPADVATAAGGKQAALLASKLG